MNIKKCVLILILIIFFAFLLITIRKVCILNYISNKEKIAIENNPQNYYMKTTSYNNGTMNIIESYNYGENYLTTTINYICYDNIQKMTYYKKGESTLTLTENQNTKVQSNIEGMPQLEPLLYNYDLVFNVKYSFLIGIKSEKIDGKDCYVIKQSNQEEFYEKDTGFLVKRIDISKNLVVDYDYLFGVVKEDNIKKPDTTGFIQKQ